MVFTRPMLFLRPPRRARVAGGSLQLAAPIPSVRRLISLARLSGVLPITLSSADVIAAQDRPAITGRSQITQSPPARTLPAPG